MRGGGKKDKKSVVKRPSILPNAYKDSDRSGRQGMGRGIYSSGKKPPCLTPTARRLKEGDYQAIADSRKKETRGPSDAGQKTIKSC